MITIVKSDFQGIANIAVHCNQDILNIAIREAIEHDLKPLMCDEFYPLFDEWDGVDSGSNEVYQNLINEHTWENCAGHTVRHPGLKRVLLLYIYSRYVYLNGMQDTATGLVQKQRDFSIPVSEKELSSVATRYRNMAFDAWQEVRLFICNEGDDTYPSFDFSTCPNLCACGGSCGKTNTGAKRYKGRKISRK